MTGCCFPTNHFWPTSEKKNANSIFFRKMDHCEKYYTAILQKACVNFEAGCVKFCSDAKSGIAYEFYTKSIVKIVE